MYHIRRIEAYTGLCSLLLAYSAAASPNPRMLSSGFRLSMCTTLQRRTMSHHFLQCLVVLCSPLWDSHQPWLAVLEAPQPSLEFRTSVHIHSYGSVHFGCDGCVLWQHYRIASTVRTALLLLYSCTYCVPQPHHTRRLPWPHLVHFPIEGTGNQSSFVLLTNGMCLVWLLWDGPLVVWWYHRSSYVYTLTANAEWQLTAYCSDDGDGWNFHSFQSHHGPRVRRRRNLAVQRLHRLRYIQHQPKVVSGRIYHGSHQPVPWVCYRKSFPPLYFLICFSFLLHSFINLCKHSLVLSRHATLTSNLISVLSILRLLSNVQDR